MGNRCNFSSTCLSLSERDGSEPIIVMRMGATIVSEILEDLDVISIIGEPVTEMRFYIL